MPFGYIDFNHEAIRGKTPQEKDEQVVAASHFPERIFKSKVQFKVLGIFLALFQIGCLFD